MLRWMHLLTEAGNLLIQAIEQFEPIIVASKEEEIICINLDMLTL